MKDAFRKLYHGRNGTPIADVLEQMRADGEADSSKPVAHLCEWLSTNLNQSINGRVQQGCVIKPFT